MEFFERPDEGERAILVHLDFQVEDAREELEEFKELVLSAGAEPVAIVQGSRRAPDPKYFHFHCSTPNHHKKVILPTN